MQRYETAWLHTVAFMVSYLGETRVKDEYRGAGAVARVASQTQMPFKTVFITGRMKFVTSVRCHVVLWLHLLGEALGVQLLVDL